MTNTVNLDTMFPHIAGYEKIREEGAQIIDIMLRSEEYIKQGAHVPRGWFFYGDPGMGKTRIVKDIAEYLNYPIVEISSSDAIRRNVTIDEDIVKGFAESHEYEKCIIFIDELDKFAGYRKFSYEVPENLKTQKILLHELDEIVAHKGAIVIATGNKRDLLNDTILRSGRFDRQIMFPRPNAKDRKEIINLFVKDASLDSTVEIDELVKMTAGCSCAEIESMVNEAKIAAISKHNESININDLLSGLARIRYNDIPQDDNSTAEQLKHVAYHEAGHAIMCYLLKPDLLHSVTIVPHSGSAGSVLINGDEDTVKTLAYYEDSVKIGLGGMCAQEVMTNTLTSGNSSDIDSCVSTIRGMLDEGFFGFEYVPIQIYGKEYSYGETNHASSQMERRASVIVSKLRAYYIDTKQILDANKDAIERLATELIDRKELSKREIMDVLDNICKHTGGKVRKFECDGIPEDVLASLGRI